MPIQAGDTLPAATFQLIDGEEVRSVGTADVFDGRRVLLFGVPGAFTPTCSARHLPGFVEHLERFRARGVEVACMAVNDAFVMRAWAASAGVPPALRMIADGNAALTHALGLEMDASGFGMGERCRRFALYAEDGVVRFVNVEEPGEFRVSAAEHVLAQLPAQDA
ncbi:peroxiredoxin [Coralloluteibacterium thermophilus]|uniref:Glutathione-dependent peroxiredoxin n=1 Tax=Coralloluteibacterium thermophilum TaxID=2707049 RepID=A0ABV9NJP5_9GAMM